MMLNSTQVSHFTLTAYLDSEVFRYVNFSVLAALYGFILAANVLLMVVICVNRSLHEPMYMFVCSLFVNELYGSTGLFPFLLVQIISDVHTVPAALCFLQIFSVYSYAHVEFCNLAVMAYDRYLAICFPLQYSSLMTSSKIMKLIALTWLPPLAVSVMAMLLTVSLRLCGNIIHKVYCDNFSILKLACSDITSNNAVGLVYVLTVTVAFIALILYTYVHILRVCCSGSTRTRQKAVSTCTPHLASLFNFCFGCFFDLVQSRFDMSGVPDPVRVLLSVYFLTCPPLFNPLLYGLNMSEIRRLGRRLFCGR